MSVAFLDALARWGVSVARDGDRLLVDGPEDVLTDDVVAIIMASKPELLALLDPMDESLGRPTPPDDPPGHAPSGETTSRPVAVAASAEGDAVTEMAPSPWRCFPCGGAERHQRAAWGDWVCARCGVIVAGPDKTERPWRMRRRFGPFPCGGQPAVVWGSERGDLAVRDPHTGDWHQIPYREAPPVWQAAVRRKSAP